MLVEPLFVGPDERQKKLNEQFMAEGQRDMFAYETLKHGYYCGVENLILDRTHQDLDWTYDIKRYREENPIPDYGFVDTIEQFEELFEARIIAHPKAMCVFFELMTKEHHGGMRWHKNGQYHGKFELCCEHFRDEPYINEVIHFKTIMFKDSLLPTFKLNSINKLLKP